MLSEQEFCHKRRKYFKRNHKYGPHNTDWSPMRLILNNNSTHSRPAHVSNDTNEDGRNSSSCPNHKDPVHNQLDGE